MTFEALPRPSPGAMTAAMRAHGPLALELRVALAQGDRIVEERRVSRGEDVTIGATERCTFLAGGPKRLLFAQDASTDTGFAFVAGGDAGRIVAQQGAPTLDPATLPKGTRIAIGPGARGRVAIGDATVLFDLVPARLRTRAALPASVKKGLFGDVDWSFTAFVTAAMLGCFGFVAVTESADPPIAFDDATALEAVAHMVIETPVEPPPAAMVSNAANHDDPSTPSTPSNQATRPSNVRPARPSHADPNPTLDPSQVAMAAADQAQILLVGSLDRNDGAFRDMLRNGLPTAGQAEIMSQVHGAVVASNDTTMHARNPGGTDDGSLLGLAHHIATGGPVDEGHGPTETVVHAIVTIDRMPGPLPPPDPNFDPSQVIRAIRLRAPMIQACYEHHLRDVPGAGGKVTVDFTIERAGTVSHVTDSENTADAATARCAEDVVAHLRFPNGPSDPEDFEFPFVFAPQN